MIDRVAADLGRRLVEVPVGFKWFVPGLLDGSVGFGGEETAGASFLRRDGSVWTTDKDGILLCPAGLRDPRRDRAVARASTTRELVAALRRPGVRPGRRARHARAEGPARRSSRPTQVTATELAGEPITGQADRGARQRRGDRRPEGDHRERPGSPPGRRGTEDVYKIYAESFRGPDHLAQVQAEAREVVSAALAG